MNKQLIELKLRIDCYRLEIEKEHICFSIFISMIDFFLSRNIDDGVVDLWLEDYADEVEAIKKLLDRFEKQSIE